jgi:hypothetical protein
MDTSPSESGRDVRPVVHDPYDGGTILPGRSRAGAHPRGIPGAAQVRRRRCRHRLGEDAARRRRQSWNGGDHGRPLGARRLPETRSSRAAHRVHPGRGGRPGHRAHRHGPGGGAGVHRRRGARRPDLDGVLPCAQGPYALHRAQRPPRPGQGEDDQRGQGRCLDGFGPPGARGSRAHRRHGGLLPCDRDLR